MKRDWQLGDVAMVTDPARFGERAMILLGHDPANRCWHGVADNGDVRCLDANQAESVRPLVVIDPECIDEVDRLRDAVWRGGPLDAWQSALREFANPTPPKPPEPKPPEPMGLGAVVEDINGVPWVRCENADQETHWYGRNKRRESYEAIDAVRVLSEGVTA